MPKDIRITDLPDDLHRDVRRLAVEDDSTFKAQVLAALRMWVEIRHAESAGEEELARWMK